MGRKVRMMEIRDAETVTPALNNALLSA